MPTVLEDYKRQLKRAEEKYGPNDRFVKMLREQVRAGERNQGKTLKEMYVSGPKPK